MDSSVAVKWALMEADTPQANRLADDVRQGSGQPVVLDLAFVEVGNAIWKHCHRRRISPDEARNALKLFLNLTLRSESARPLYPPALDIALKYDRAFYDALFVALVQQLNLPGVTADEPLVRAVQADFPQIKLLRDW